VVEGVAPPPSGPSLPLADSATAGGAGTGAIDLPMVFSAGATHGPPAVAARASASTRSWVEADHLDLVPVGELVSASVGGSELIVANVDGTLLAYANACANCGGPLDEGALDDGTLACPRCARTFFLPSAGRSLDDERLQLVPFPLLREQGRVKIALTL
jgi:nitrite reductase/ring-hydroxylating ferredoxin subunit